MTSATSWLPVAEWFHPDPEKIAIFSKPFRPILTAPWTRWLGSDQSACRPSRCLVHREPLSPDQASLLSVENLLTHELALKEAISSLRGSNQTMLRERLARLPSQARATGEEEKAERVHESTLEKDPL